MSHKVSTTPEYLNKTADELKKDHLYGDWELQSRREAKALPGEGSYAISLKKRDGLLLSTTMPPPAPNEIPPPPPGHRPRRKKRRRNLH